MKIFNICTKRAERTLNKKNKMGKVNKNEHIVGTPEHLLVQYERTFLLQHTIWFS